MTDSDDELDLEPDGASPLRLATFALPVLTAVVALVVGAVIGGGLVTFLPDRPTVVEVARDLTNEELDAICAPKVDEAVAEAADTIEDAEEKVRTLEAEVSSQQDQVEALEAEMSRRSVRGRELVEELERARSELVALETRLEHAIQEKEALVVDLRKTEEALEDQTEQTELARGDARDYRWRSFVRDAQLEICERGGRRRMGRCRETVTAALGPAVREHFEHCLRAGQEMPSLEEAERGQDELPEFSQWVDDDMRLTRGWYIRLCDPTLPEAEDPLSVDAETARERLGDEDPDDALDGWDLMDLD